MNDDSLQRFIFDHTAVRGEYVRLRTSYQEAVKQHNYPPLVERTLGEFLVAISMLSSTLKFDGMISIQARGNGKLAIVMAECTHHKRLRGIVRGELASVTEHDTLSSLLGDATLAITIEPTRGERYQGIVPLEGETLAQCLEQYFQQSEQLHTQIQIAVNDEVACGFLLQRLPHTQHTKGDVPYLADGDERWNHLSMLGSTLKPDEMIELPSEQILHRLFHQEPLRLLEQTDIRFGCSCSEERIGQALVSLGIEEVESILDEIGTIEIECHFCLHQYRFDPDRARALFADTPSKH